MDVINIISATAITPRFDREQREPDRIVNVNVNGVVNALEVARQLPHFRRFVQISSCAVFGDNKGLTVLDEDSPANATNLYGVTKLAGERIALRYADLFGLDVVAVRPSNVYGPMERPTPGYAGATELREMLRVHFAGEPIKVAAVSRSIPRLDLRRGRGGGDRAGLGYHSAPTPALHPCPGRAVLGWRRPRRPFARTSPDCNTRSCRPAKPTIQSAVSLPDRCRRAGLRRLIWAGHRAPASPMACVTICNGSMPMARNRTFAAIGGTVEVS